MTGLKVLYRHIQAVPAEKWTEKLKLEQLTDEAESEAGYPIPRRYRPLFSNQPCETVRVESRIFDSYSHLGEKMEARGKNPRLVELDVLRRKITLWEREELFYVDSGSPVPRWMQGVSRKPIPPEVMAEANAKYPLQSPDKAQLQQNIAQGKLRILYRLIQKVPADRWGEKLEQERISDAAESAAGHPLPMRYRAMFGSEKSQIRINEREYDSLSHFLSETEAFLENREDYGDCMDAEIRRQEFFEWEREEIYIVDTDSFIPKWMEYAAECVE